MSQAKAKTPAQLAPKAIDGAPLAALPELTRSHVSGQPGPKLWVLDGQEDLEAWHLAIRSYFDVCELPDYPILLHSASERSKHLDAPLSESTLSFVQIWFALSQKKDCLILSQSPTLLKKWMPLSVFQAQSETLKLGAQLDLEPLYKGWLNKSYRRVNQVEHPGEFSVRGSIVDIFSPQATKPYRLEFFDDELEHIHFFNTETQRSEKEPLDSAIVLPAGPYCFEPSLLAQAKKRLKDHCLSHHIEASLRLKYSEALDEAQSLWSENELLLPIYYEHSECLLELCQHVTMAVVEPELLKQELSQIYLKLDNDDPELSEKPVLGLGPKQNYPPQAKAETYLREEADLVVGQHLAQSYSNKEAADLEDHSNFKAEMAMAKDSGEKFTTLERLLSTRFNDQWRQLIFCESKHEIKTLSGVLQSKNLEFRVLASAEQIAGKASSMLYICQGQLQHGFSIPSSKQAFYAYAELLGHKIKKHKELKAHPSIKEVEKISAVGELQEGQAIVHVDFGIGLYKGMKRLELVPGSPNDFLELEYADGDKIFLPVYRLNRIHKYVGADAKKPSLEKLGQNSRWEQTKARAKKAVEEMAQDLIELYAKRQVAKKKPYQAPDEMFQNFEAAFPFEETVDQNKALEDIEQDLQSDKPMDRLVCGDVGFGKTEIALRAAFRSVLQGKQVAVLVPTTVLCQQHYQTFADRMQKFPVKIDFLSRFKSRKEIKEVLEQLKTGELDVVIGTHRLLSKDVKFKNLGLLVLDEEHRFGVKHKEEIKKYRNLVNVLTLTATPIPRTLQLSMAGIRDLSIINTPPLDRKAVTTYVCQREDGVIRDAIANEINRQGQVFFLHNRVETIEAQVMYLKSLLPQARIIYGHGQMSETQLEKVMLAFIKGDADVLVATTIIESGLDIPNANTILINRADTLGLAQLYQLRGRVGRSQRKAYCYLLTPGEEVVGKDALKRLKALQRFTDLGSGLKIAMHDLEIRGAGNLLGQAQSGQIANVGFELYTQLLEREVRKLKGEKIEEDFEPEIQVQLPAYIPESYISNEHERLRSYKRLSAAKDQEELEGLMEELQDRFGNLPPTVENLQEVIELKMLAKKCHVQKLSIHAHKPVIEFRDSAEVNMDRLLLLMRNNKNVKLTPEQKLIVELDSNSDAYQETRDLLQYLTQKD